MATSRCGRYQLGEIAGSVGRRRQVPENILAGQSDFGSAPLNPTRNTCATGALETLTHQGLWATGTLIAESVGSWAIGRPLSTVPSQSVAKGRDGCGPKRRGATVPSGCVPRRRARRACAVRFRTGGMGERCRTPEYPPKLLTNRGRGIISGTGSIPPVVPRSVCDNGRKSIKVCAP